MASSSEDEGEGGEVVVMLLKAESVNDRDWTVDRMAKDRPGMRVAATL